jgi:hypothetical protein
MVGGHLNWIPGAAKGWRITQIEVIQLLNSHGGEERGRKDVKSL